MNEPITENRKQTLAVFVTLLTIFAGEILFRWSPDKSKLIRQFWEDYVLVVETLEENQVNIPSSTVDTV